MFRLTMALQFMQKVPNDRAVNMTTLHLNETMRNSNLGKPVSYPLTIVHILSA